MFPLFFDEKDGPLSVKHERVNDATRAPLAENSFLPSAITGRNHRSVHQSLHAHSPEVVLDSRPTTHTDSPRHWAILDRLVHAAFGIEFTGSSVTVGTLSLPGRRCSAKACP